MFKKTGLLQLCLVSLSLTACGEMYAEPTVTDRRVQVREEKFSEQVSVSQVNGDYIAGVAQAYMQSGKGPVNVTVTYDPESGTNTAMRAGDQAVRISTAFRKEGVANVVTGLLPVREQGLESVAVISYSSYQAAAPVNCTEMPGMGYAPLDHDPAYKIGCTVESVFARQIADPSDLLGEAKASPYSQGRPSSNVIQVYQTGAPNKPLKGTSSSD